MWWGNVGSDHEKTFKRTALDWCRENWGTKWNAYEHHEIARTESTLTLVFDTAWSPPYPWLAAVFNTLKLGFEHNWFDEGQCHGNHAVFDWNAFENDDFGRRDWFEEMASDELFKHLHVLKYGCESFPDDEVA